MARQDNLSQFLKEIDSLDSLFDDVTGAIVDVAGDAYEELTEDRAETGRGSPVVTGAYRSEHVIHVTNEADPGLGAPLYASPTRSGPDEIVAPGGEPIEAPDPAEAREALSDPKRVPRLSSITLMNERFYAESVEDRHNVYGDVADSAEDALEFEASRLSRRRVR